MSDETPPKRRKVQDNLLVSPKKCVTNKRRVVHYVCRLGDGTVLLEFSIVEGREGVEPYTLPAKKCVDDRVPGKILDLGFVMTSCVVSLGGTNELNNDQIYNHRGYAWKGLIAQKDTPYSDEECRIVAQGVCDVSSTVVLFIKHFY